jgi:hypothetical protein
MGKCCEDQELIYHFEVGYICENCKAIDFEETQNYIDEQTYNYYYKPRLTKQRIGYHPKYHVNEVLKQIECVEPNKPTNLDEIRNKLNGDYTLRNIFKVCKKERKHIIYLYVTLNNLQAPFISYFLEDQILCTITRMYQNREKLPRYFHIIDRIFQKYGFDELRKFLYFKPSKQSEKRNKFIDQYI